MNAFDTLIDRLKQIEESLIITLSDVINDNSEQLEDAQREQMSIGKNALNKNIGRLKNQGYAKSKKSSGGKAPKYGGSTLKSNNEQGKKEASTYEYKHTTTKTPSDSRSGGKGGSYEGTPSGSISKRKDSRVDQYHN